MDKITTSGEEFAFDRFKIEQVCFQYTDSKYPAPIPWFFEATSIDTLTWQLSGCISALAPKGVRLRVYISDLLTPAQLPYIKLYRSEHGNWHVGLKKMDVYDPKVLKECNEGKYSYFQNEKFFIALRPTLEVDEDGRIIVSLYVHKKPQLPETEARAIQD